MKAFAGAILLVLSTSCTTEFVDTTDVVTGPRLLAVQTVPAEVAPTKPFMLTPLYVGPNGALDPSSLDWASCLLQKPLGEPGPINPACFVDTSAELVPLGTAGPGSASNTVTATMDSNACELFGPESPPPKTGQPSARPTDPDSTGGFYFPVRVKARGDADPWSVSLERVSCQPSEVTSDVFTAFETEYVANANPVVTTLLQIAADGTQTTLSPDDSASSQPTPAIALPTQVKLSLQVSWPDCSQVPAGTTCGGAESYVAIDPTSKQLVTRRESMVASWFATGGTFDASRVGRNEDDVTTSATDGWETPASPATVHLWVVLRDARGGTGWASYTIAVH